MAHVRFETFLLIPEEIAERRRRSMMGALAAATLSMALGVSSWTADKLGISRVAPPKHTYAVTLQVLEPPPPPPAPPPIAGIVEKDTTRDVAARDEPERPEPDVVPDEVIPLDPDVRPRTPGTVPGTGGKTGGGSPHGSIDGIPGTGARCLLPPCLGTTPIVGTPLPQPKPSTTPPEKAPITAVMATAVFAPNPDQARLARTPTGRSHRSPGKTTVSFCIDGSGKTYDVRVRRGFPGDPEVDEICRATVSKWRFSPQRVGGKVRSTCSQVTFDIRFE